MQEATSLAALSSLKTVMARISQNNITVSLLRPCPTSEEYGSIAGKVCLKKSRARQALLLTGGLRAFLLPLAFLRRTHIHACAVPPRVYEKEK
jgi:hypothetical protein